MTGTETRVRDALAEIDETYPLDVDRMWHKFDRQVGTLSGQRGRRDRWLMPLAAAAAMLVILGLVVVARGHVGGPASKPISKPASLPPYALDQLPAWPDGSAAATYPLPAPASTPVVFDVAAPGIGPEPMHTRLVAYYADDPSRLCLIQIFGLGNEPEHTVSMACVGPDEFAAEPLSRGPGWLAGTLPPGSETVDVTVDGKPVEVAAAQQDGMPRALFFAQLPVPHSPAGIRWVFKDADGHETGHGGNSSEAQSPPPAPADTGLVFHAPPVSATAEFEESSNRYDPAGSHRVVGIYYAGTDHGWCSYEHVLAPGARTKTVSEDCGATTSADRVMPTVQWLPADTSEDADSVTGWGVMPPGAARAAAVSAGAKTVLHSAQLTGMPNGVYAGTAHVSGTSVVLYFLDSAGQVVAAEPWYVNR